MAAAARRSAVIGQGVPHLIVSIRGRLALVAAAVAIAVPLTQSGAASASPPAQKHRPKIVYFTFDDGPNSLNSPRLLKILAREQVPATFFLVGQSLAADPGAATRLWLGGHAVGNHTWSHADLTHLSTAGVAAQLRSTQRLLGPGAGACMRPPYGATNAAVSAVAAQTGLRQVMWTVDPQDWAHQDANYIAGHVLNHVRDRSIVLMHDGGGSRAATISAVKAMIPLLRLRGFEFRTVPACRVPLGGTITGAAEPAKRARPNPPSPLPTPVEVPAEPVTP